MLLAEESTKYVGDNQGILNLKLMQQLYHVVAYNLAKSRAARDLNTTKQNEPRKRKNFRPKELKQNGLVLVRDHTLGAFEPRGIDHHIVDFSGNQVIVKDNHGNIKTVHRKNVQPVEMDIATAEFFRKEREKSTIRNAKHIMPIKQIPNLNWKFNENINQVEAVKPEEGKQGEHSPCMLTLTESTPDNQAENTEHTEAMDKVEAVEPIKAVEPVETVEPAEAVEPVEAVEPSEAVEPVEAVEQIVAESACPTEIARIEEGQQGEQPPHTPTPPRPNTTPQRENGEPCYTSRKRNRTDYPNSTWITTGK